MKYVLIILALAGGYYYVSRHVKFDDSLQYVRQHKAAFWAPRANYYIALSCHLREDYPRSQAAFTQLLTDYPAGPYAARGLVCLGEAADSNGDWDTAKQAFARYVEEHPDGPDIGIVRKRLEMLRYHHGP